MEYFILVFPSFPKMVSFDRFFLVSFDVLELELESWLVLKLCSNLSFLLLNFETVLADNCPGKFLVVVSMYVFSKKYFGCLDLVNLDVLIKMGSLEVEVIVCSLCNWSDLMPLFFF